MRAYSLARRVSLVSAFALVGATAHAAPLLMMFERTTDVTANEIAFRYYANNDAMVANTPSQPDAFSALNLGAGFDSSGVTWDGTQFITMFERNTDVSTNEIAFRFYADLAAMVANTPSQPDAFSALNLGAGFNSTGLTWDGTQFIMMFERNTDVTTNEIAFRFYADIASMIANTPSRPDAFSTLNLGAGFDSRGLTWDGSLFTMMFERTIDVATNEIAFRYYGDVDSMISNTVARPDAFSALNLSGAFNASGLAAYDFQPPVIPLPAPVVALGSALAMLLGVGVRGRRHRAASATG